jgi:hypothetical protein
MFSQMSLVDLHSSTGVSIGKVTRYDLSESDKERVGRVVEKNVRGLFFKEFGLLVPTDWVIKVCWITPETEQKWNLSELRNTMRWNVIRADTFAYGVTYVPETYQSAWILDFFQIPLFYVLVVDKETATHPRNSK